MQVNPYNAPASGPQFSRGANPYQMAFVPALASIGARFVARTIDGILPAIIFFVYFAASVTSILSDAEEYQDRQAEEEYVLDEEVDYTDEEFQRDYFEDVEDIRNFEYEPDEADPAFEEELAESERAARKQLLLFLLLFGGFQCVQYYLISTSGQSIGKKLLGIRIVTEEGRPVGFWDGVVKREWGIAALSSIPINGGFIGMYDTLSIFRADRRMLHDRIAGTVVVIADSVGPDGVQPRHGRPPKLRRPRWRRTLRAALPARPRRSRPPRPAADPAPK